MQLSFTGHNVDVTTALRAYTEEKLNKLKEHFDRINSIHVVFEIERLNQIAEATIKIAKGTIHARSESEHMYASIDSLVDKLDRQLIKHKEKTHNHRD